MSKNKGQRIAIWIIAIVLTAGTLGSFVVMILANDNAKIDQARQQEQLQAYQKEVDDYEAKVSAQAAELSEIYYGEFSKYADVPRAFNANDVDELSTRDLKTGDGNDIKQDSDYSAYYIGWNPSGTIFDQSIEGESLKSPITKGGLIEGWNEGVVGMKVGGVREITIPSDKAYGETGNGDAIAPNTPIKFIVMIIPKVEQVPIPDLTRFFN